MKTYVVNMKKDVIKRQLIETQLHEHPDLQYVIWEAIEGKKLTQEEQEQMISPLFYSRYSNVTLPTAGCSLSHYFLYKDIINNNLEFALILEDDAILPKELNIEQIIHILKTDKPTVVLLTPDFWYRKEQFCMNVDREHELYRLYDGYMTSGYLINLAAAKLLVPKIYPIQYTADAWSDFVKMGLRLFGLVPHIISFPDGMGEIGISRTRPQGVKQRIKTWILPIYFKYIYLKRRMHGDCYSKKIWR